MSNPYTSSPNNDYRLYETLFEAIDTLGNSKKMKLIKQAEEKFFQELEQLAQCQSFETGIERYDYATVLHKAITVFSSSGMESYGAFSSDQYQKPENVQKRVLQRIIENYSKLIYCDRRDSDKFRGQTPLHMAIAKEDKELVEMLLQAARNPNVKHGIKKILSQNATGLMFTSNVMMGQLPLSVAVLTDNKEIVTVLLECNKNLVYLQNSLGDNLCHSLLKYASMIPERSDNALEMMKFIMKEMKDLSEKLFLMQNNDKETPLILAAKYGKVDLADFIFEKGYCSSDKSSGLFDVKLYDMTDIDHQLREYRRQEDEKEKLSLTKDVDTRPPPTVKGDAAPSVFDMIFDHSYKISLKFMTINPIQSMIKRKWRKYCCYLYFGLVMHIVLMSLLTAAAVERVKSRKPGTISQGLGAPFPAYFSIIVTIISLLYIWIGCFKIVQICRRKFQINFKPFLNPYGNAVFHTLFFLFALCIISDFGATWSPEYNNMLLIIAVVIGWFLLLFFLRATNFFCLFTSLIQRILIQDITRFAPIIVLQLVAFSTAMMMLLHNPDNQGNNSYSSWEGMLMLTFKSFLGVADIEIADSSHPAWLSIVYVAFVVMTTILMLNALIAILSSTCTDLIQNFSTDMHLHLQQLAVILFFEGLLPNCITHKYAKDVTKQVETDTYDTHTKTFSKMKRHLLRILVIEDDDVGNSEVTFAQNMLNLMRGKYTVKDKPSQSNQPIQTHTLSSTTKNYRSTMTGTVEHLDMTRRLDIYHHTQT